MYRCLVCGRILRSNNPDALIDHLRLKHPFIKIDRSPRTPSPRRGIVRSCPPGCPLPDVPKLNCRVCLPQPTKPVPPPCPPALKPCAPCYPSSPCNPCPPCGPCPPQPCPPPPPCPPVPCPPPCAVNCPPPTTQDYCRAMREQNRRERRTKYKCTVESWQPGLTKVVCPCCGCENMPIIRRQKNMMASSSLGACIMLGCWPLNCLPFLCCESTVVNLYCANCDTFLGTYNRKLGCVTDIQGNMCNPGVTPNFPSVP